MKTFISFLLLLLLLSGCVSTGDMIDQNIKNIIPDDATQMIIHTDQDSDELFDSITRRLIRDGHRIESNRENLTISTDQIDVGESTFARFTLYIEDGSVYGRSDWKPGTQASAMASAFSGVNIDAGWETAKWTNGRPGRAFASMVELLLDMPHSHFEFK